MSGIAVIFRLDDRPPAPEALWAMLEASAYRGPDGGYAEFLGPVALGYLHMAIAPEEVHETQPLVSPLTGCAIVADARIDNREEMLSRLRHSTSRNSSDAHIILRAYEEWGEQAVSMLLGDFALMIWDPRRQRLLCARDSAGRRELYYRSNSREFVAASDLHQLMQDPFVPVLPNPDKVHTFLLPSSVLSSEKQEAATYYEGLWSVEPGSLLVVEQGHVSSKRYWDLRPPHEIRYRRESDYAEHFLDLFAESVRARLRSSHKVGLLLSGGLDSSSIACMVQLLYRTGRAKDGGFATFSTVYEGLECDERPLIAEIQDMYGFEAHFLSPGGYAGRLQLEPAGFQVAPNMGMSEGWDIIMGAAKSAGVKVLLTGDLADACIAGSPLVFDSLVRHGGWRELLRRLQAYRKMSGAPLLNTLLWDCGVPLLPIALQRWLMAKHVLRAAPRSPERLLPDWMPRELRRELGAMEIGRRVSAERNRLFSSPARQQEYELLYPPPLECYPAPWSLQIAQPFADRRLHEYLLAIPPEVKYRPHPDTEEFYAGAKRVLREAMRGIMPETVRTRTSKTHFAAAFERELDLNWHLYEQAFGPRGRSEIAERGYIDQEKFWQKLQEVRHGQRGRDFLYVMYIIGLETWLRALDLPHPQVVTVPPPWHERSVTASSGVDDGF